MFLFYNNSKKSIIKKNKQVSIKNQIKYATLLKIGIDSLIKQKITDSLNIEKQKMEKALIELTSEDSVIKRKIDVLISEISELAEIIEKYYHHAISQQNKKN